MRNKKLISALVKSYQARCKFWVTCSATRCEHFDPHYPARGCKYDSPVKYCPIAKGFVYDIPHRDDAYANDECDPNLAFKAKRDAERRRDV